MKAIKLGLYCLAGLIASSTLSRAAGSFAAIQAILYGAAVLWLWTLTNFGHAAAMKIMHLDEAELGTLRATVLVVWVTGILVNWSFEGFPQWMQILF